MRGRRQLGLVVLSVGVTLMLLAGCAPCSILPIPGAAPQIQLWAEHGAVPRGGCTTLHWQVSTGEQYPVFLNGSQVAPQGQQQVCPEQTQTFELVVGAPSGSVSQTVTVQVQGGAPGPAPTSQPPAATAAPPPPPAATSAPPPPPPPAATSAPPPPAQPTATQPPPAQPTATTPPPTATPTTFVPVWGQCSWVKVHPTINSHQPVTWCANGSFLTGLDLDREGSYDAMDSPVVGQAQCCPLSTAQFSPWGQCSWKQYGNSGAASHQHQPLCPNGQYLTGLDLDRLGGADPLDSPVIGQGFCCPFGDPNKYLAWGSCSWVPVEQGGINSHQAVTWCPNGSFLAGLDLDRGSAGIDAMDSPVVGQAYCCSPEL